MNFYDALKSVWEVLSKSTGKKIHKLLPYLSTFIKFVALLVCCGVGS